MTRTSIPLLRSHAQILLSLCLVSPVVMLGQGRASAPVDLTGYWVSVVTEDWRWRMVTPLKGDSASVPVNAEARKIIDAWDPAKDETAGLQCKAYGAPAIMRVPGRLHIIWQDDNTLRIETDAGTQTRLFHFGGSPPQGAAPSWQGYSVARWEPPTPPSPAGVGAGVGVGNRLGARALWRWSPRS